MASNDTAITNSTTMEIIENALNASVSTLLQDVTTAVTSLVNNETSPPTTTVPTTTTTVKATTSTVLKTTTSSVLSTEVAPAGEEAPTSIIFISCVMFVVAVAVIAKIIISNKKKRSDLIGGTARWRISASRQSGSSATVGSGGNQTSANSYLPMGSTQRGRNSGSQQNQPLTFDLDNPGPDRLDWERQFFDDNDATTSPSRLIFR